MRYLVLLCAGCLESASPDPGLDAMLQIPDAQFRPGAFPAATGGPDALQLTTTHATILVGRLHETAVGVLAPGATGAIFGVDGFDGAWILPAGAPAFDTPDDPSANVLFGVADTFPPGPLTLRVAAANQDGEIGSSTTADLIAADAAPPSGTLVFTLAWDSNADLDLHVVDPLGGEAWSGHPNTWQTPPPGDPIDPDAWKTGGILDHDANANCVRAGTPEEDVAWQMTPPAGHYVVRVDTLDMCGDASASWYVAAYMGDTLLGSARGTSVPYDTRDAHGNGAGVLALELDL
ncbi:MAG TPA: hypothetical protein VGM88_02140 [Kofleriaceae bacterium]|jgi:hypothetical protein